MKPYHRACGSSDLITVPFRKRDITLCNHCVRQIEEHEIQRPSDIVSCVSKVTVLGKEVNHHFIDVMKSHIK